MTLQEGIKNWLSKNHELEVKMAERKITLNVLCEYITKQARELLHNRSGAVDDDTVFNWAVHYIEDAYKETPAPEKEEEEVEQEIKQEIKQESKQEKKHSAITEPVNYDQLPLFENSND